MTIRISEGLANMIAQGIGFARALHRGYIDVRSGAQPANADAAMTGTQLGIITVSSLALTKETRASATLEVTGGSGTLTGVSIGTLPIVVDPGLVVWATSTTVTAALIRDAINRSGIARATSSGAVVTVKAPPGVGTSWNGLALAAAGITCTGSNFASGVAGVNGLYLDQPAAGVIAKPAGVVWSCVGLAPGTAGWFRYFSSDTNDSGGLLTTLTEPLYARLDGSCGVGSQDLQLSSLTFSLGSPHTVDSASFTMPRS